MLGSDFQLNRQYCQPKMLIGVDDNQASHETGCLSWLKRRAAVSEPMFLHWDNGLALTAE